MALDRGRLAKIDRRLLAELDHGDGPQTVKVPLSDAAWSTWRRYCDVLGLTMGEGIAGLIDDELGAVVDDGGAAGTHALFAIRADEQLIAREAQVAARERDAESVKRRQREWSVRLRRWEDQIEERELRVEQTSRLAVQSRNTAPKIGRNDRCPCESGLKYKHCHGLLERGRDDGRR